MLMKYIEGYVYNDSKVYSYDNCSLQFDENKYSLNISDEYLENDINNNICYLYNIFDDLVKRRLYSSESNTERAARIIGIIKYFLLYGYIKIYKIAGYIF